MALYSADQFCLFFDRVKNPINPSIQIHDEHDHETRQKNALKMIWSIENSINQNNFVYPTFTKINNYIFNIFNDYNLINYNQSNYSQINPGKAFTGTLDQILLEELSSVLFYKDLNSSVLPLISLPSSKIQRQAIVYGYNSFLGQGSYYFLIQDHDIIEAPGLVIDCLEDSIIIHRYCGLNDSKPFECLNKTIFCDGYKFENWISAIKSPDGGPIFIPFTQSKQDDRIVERYLLEEIKDIVTATLNDKKNIQENLVKVQLLIEGLAPELVPSLQQSVEIARQKNEKGETINPVDVPLINALDQKIDTYSQMIVNEQQLRTKMVADNSHYKFNKPEKVQKKKSKHKSKSKKSSKKSEKQVVSTAQPPKLKINFDQEVTGAIKFRKLTKLIGQMMKDLPIDQVQSIVTGSHLNFHGDQADKQTLVLKSGGTSVAPSTARKIVDGFMSFFQKSMTQTQQIEKEKI